MNFFIRNKQIKLNIVIVEGGYMSGIPVKKNTCTNQNSLAVKVFSPLGQYLVEAPFAAMTAMSVFW